MSCGFEAFVLALKLASDVAIPQPVPGLIFTTNAICGCECALTVSAKYSCMAARAADEESRTIEHNKKVTELKAIANMCIPKS